MGPQGGGFSPAQPRGAKQRRLHQIFIRASVRSLGAHYRTKAAENILEEPLNKNTGYL